MRFDAKKDTKRLIYVVISSFVSAVNIKTFVRAGDLFPGGATGLSLLIQRASAMFAGVDLPYSLINILLNAFPVYIGFRYIGKKFTFFSLVYIVLNSFFVDLLPSMAITYDILLISIFGGIINGACISLVLSVDATSGGTDFFSIYMSQKKGIDTFNYILGFNIIILSVAGLLFGWDAALYSIVFQYTSTQALHALYRNYQQQTLFVITNMPNEVAAAIHDISHHGATIIRAEGSYKHTERDIVYSIVSGAEAKNVIRMVKTIDPKAFINSMRSTEIKGNFFLRPKD